MTFHTSLSIVAFLTSVTRPTFSHFVSPPNIFSSAAFSFDHSSYNKSFFLLITLPKKVAWCLRFLFIRDFVVSASHNTVPFNSLQSMRFVAFSHKEPHFYCLQFLFNCYDIVHLAPIHQNLFNIAPQGSSSTVKCRCHYLVVLISFPIPLLALI